MRSRLWWCGNRTAELSEGGSPPWGRQAVVCEQRSNSTGRGLLRQGWRGGLNSINRAEWKTLRRKNRVPVTSPKDVTSPEEGQGRKKGERRGGGGWRWGEWEAKINWLDFWLELCPEKHLRWLWTANVEKTLITACIWLWHQLEKCWLKPGANVDRGHPGQGNHREENALHAARFNFRQRLFVKISYDATASFNLFKIPLQILFCMSAESDLPLQIALM